MIGDAALAGRFVEMAGFRNRLTHFYREVTPEELYVLVVSQLDDVELVSAELRRSAARLAISR